MATSQLTRVYLERAQTVIDLAILEDSREFLLNDGGAWAESEMHGWSLDQYDARIAELKVQLENIEAGIALFELRAARLEQVAS